MSTLIWCYKMQFDFLIHLLVLPLVRLHLIVLLLVRLHLHLLVHSNVCIESSFCPANAHLDVRLRDAVCSFKSLLLPARNGAMLLTPSPAIFAFLSQTMLQWYNAFNTLPSYFHLSLPDNVARVQYILLLIQSCNCELFLTSGYFPSLLCFKLACFRSSDFNFWTLNCTTCLEAQETWRLLAIIEVCDFVYRQQSSLWIWILQWSKSKKVNKQTKNTKIWLHLFSQE